MGDYIKTGPTSALKLEEYKGGYSLTAGWVNKDGEFKPNWCEVEFGKEKTKKKMPIKISLGNSERTKEIIRELLSSFDDTPF